MPKGAQIGIKAPVNVGVSPQDLSKVSIAALQIPESHLKEGEHLASDQIVLYIMGVSLTQQYHINKGICLFGGGTRVSVRKELMQLHDHVAYCLVHAHKPTPEQWKQALTPLILSPRKDVWKSQDKSLH